MLLIEANSSVLTKRQHKKVGPKVYTEDGHTYRITATIRHDDDCGNGHNTFSITCDIDLKLASPMGPIKWEEYSSGCCHEEFAKYFPEYAHLIKWHLTSTDGPLHYLANTLYLAGNKDHNGRHKGDVTNWSCGVRFGNSPVTHKLRNSFYDFLQERMGTGDFQVTAIAHGPDNNCGGYKFRPKYTLIGYGEHWHECPFDTEFEAREFCGALNNVHTEFVSIPLTYSEGKERQLDFARAAAVWPDATDEDLTAPGLKERLEARLPTLLQEFQTDVCNIGLTY